MTTISEEITGNLFPKYLAANHGSCLDSFVHF